ncbi:MAG: hypothetical protein SFW35_07085 [Chitinophagales bacterium]|nr:hypothetical protein [Chitinophagales bacterium]
MGTVLFEQPIAQNQRMKPAIVILGYNRPQCLKRLIQNLIQAEYDVPNIDLIISLDKGAHKECVQFAQAFHWPYGNKEVVVQQKRLYTYGQVHYAASLAEKYGAVIALEDDLGVSPQFYKYAQQVLSFYSISNNIAGISLYSYQLTENNYQSFDPLEDDYDTYLMQFPASWGQAFTYEQWLAFLKWKNHTQFDQNNLPEFVREWSGKSWKREFLEYMIAENKYFAYPRAAYSTNFGDNGANYAISMSLFQVPLAHNSPKTFRFAKSLEAVTYDAWFEPTPATVHKYLPDLSEPIAIVDTLGTKDLTFYNDDLALSIRTSLHPVRQFVFQGKQLVLAKAHTFNNLRVRRRVEDANYDLMGSAKKMPYVFYKLWFVISNYLLVLKKRLQRLSY